MLLPLDGPSKQFSVTVNSTTPVEVKAGASAFLERKVITLQNYKTDTNKGDFYVYFADDGVVPSSGDVSSDGFIQSKNSKESYEAAGSQAVYIMAVSGSVDVRGAERA